MQFAGLYIERTTQENIIYTLIPKHRGLYGFILTSFSILFSGCCSLKPVDYNNHLVKAPLSDRANIVLAGLMADCPIVNGRWQNNMDCTPIQSTVFGYCVGKRRNREDIIRLGRIAAKNERDKINSLVFQYLVGKKNVNRDEASGFPALFVSGVFDRRNYDYFLFSKIMDLYTRSNAPQNGDVVANMMVVFFLSQKYRIELNPNPNDIQLARLYHQDICTQGYPSFSAFTGACIARATQDSNDLKQAKELVLTALSLFMDKETGDVKVAPHADCLSWHLAMIDACADLAQMDPSGPWRMYAVKLLDYIFSDRYFNGKFLVHHIANDGKQANYFCAGCNFAALYLVDRLYGDSFVINPIQGPTVIKGRLEITKAIYGNDENWIDVKDKVTRLIKHNRLNIIVSNDIAGDPLPEKKKALYIEYRVKNNSYAKSCWEYESINIP